jgi:very-short-patch-repair endonuclease
MVNEYLDWEIDYLKECYGKVPTDEISFNLLRKRQSIIWKSLKLGLSFKRNVWKIYIYNNGKKGKTYEEIYGERANIEKEKRDNSKTLKKLIKEGKFKIWNKGLTKETDERVMKNAESKIGIKRPDVILRNKNPLFIEKVLKALYKIPTSFEKKISDLCIENNFPFIYSGNGTFLIGHKSPDFVNERNRIAIEVYHDYFKIRDFGSCENYERQRSNYFNKYGWKTIFIRTKEINDKNWKKVCSNKIEKYIN